MKPGDRIVSYDNRQISSPAAFLSSLPEEFKQHWIMMTRSESAQKGTPESPRFILPNAASTVVFGFALDSNTVEYFQFDAATSKFNFRAISFDVSPGRVSADDSGCVGCHSSQRVGAIGSRPRPNWDAYDSWAGALPFNRDRLYQNSLEATAFTKILKDLRNDPIVSQLAIPDGMTQDPTTGVVTIAFDPCATDLNTGDNAP